jgi:hypothetical protein
MFALYYTFCLHITCRHVQCCVMPKFKLELNRASDAKVELKKLGHSYRSAARHVGRSYQWICQVLNGQATSQPVVDAIFKLPTRHKPRGRSRGKQTEKATE